MRDGPILVVPSNAASHEVKTAADDSCADHREAISYQISEDS